MAVRSRMIAVGLAVACLALAAPVFAWDPPVTGYSQFRFNSGDSADEEFEIRRARLSWKDTVNNEGTTVRVQIDVAGLVESGGDPEVEAKDIWVSHPWSEQFSTRLGFGSSMFGYEVEYSSSKRLAFERARVIRDFFPGERDLGVYGTWQGEAVSVDLGFTNGMDKWHEDDDSAHAFLARVRVPFDGSEAGVSYMTAQREQDGGYDVSPDVWGAHVRYHGGNGLAFQGEYLDGEFLSGGTLYDADGWYGTVEYTPRAADTTIFYRYDERDRTPRSVAAAQEGATQSYRRHTLGVAWDFMKDNRLTLQIEDIDNNGSESTDFGLQWQVIYK